MQGKWFVGKRTSKVESWLTGMLYLRYSDYFIAGWAAVRDCDCIKKGRVSKKSKHAYKNCRQERHEGEVMGRFARQRDGTFRPKGRPVSSVQRREIVSSSSRRQTISTCTRMWAFSYCHQDAVILTEGVSSHDVHWTSFRWESVVIFYLLDHTTGFWYEQTFRGTDPQSHTQSFSSSRSRPNHVAFAWWRCCYDWKECFRLLRVQESRNLLKSTS